MFQIEIIITGIESRIRSRQANSAELNSSRSPALSNRYLTLLSVHVWQMNVGIRCPVFDPDDKRAIQLGQNFVPSAIGGTRSPNPSNAFPVLSVGKALSRDLVGTLG